MLVELSVVEQRYHAVLEVLVSRVPVSEVADRYGVSRKSVHAWVRRYEELGLAGLADRSHRPHHQPRQVSAAVEAAICRLRTARIRGGGRGGSGSSWAGMAVRGRCRRGRRCTGAQQDSRGVRQDRAMTDPAAESRRTRPAGRALDVDDMLVPRLRLHVRLG
jgi:hypothetical protein